MRQNIPQGESRKISSMPFKSHLGADVSIRNRGSKEQTGVCNRSSLFDHGCGIFIKKKGKNQCKISGRDMKAKVHEIRALNCEICGRLPVDGDDSCEVRIDYVDNCATAKRHETPWE